MGRHAAPKSPEHPPTHHSTSGRRLDPRVLLAGLAVLVVAAGGIVWWTVASAGGCDPTRTVRVTVAPEIGDLARSLLSGPQQLDDGSCAQAEVTTQEPLQTVGDLGALQASALPEVWVPDSSLWLARAPEGGAVTADGALASSPVVVATSRAAVDQLGWTGSPPSWPQAFGTQQPVSIPDIAQSAEAVSALGAVRAGLGGGEDADNAIVEAVLAAARGPVTTAEDALAAGSKGDVDAPLVPVSEQQVYATTTAADSSQLVAVYPSDGSPYLDYPVVRVGSPSGERSAAVDAVVARLTSRAAHEKARAAGFRTPDGAAPPHATDAGLRADAPQPIALDPADVRTLLARLSSLVAPSRILAVFDVSTSMEAPVGDGTRVTLARDAAKSALTLIPDASAIGLWDFAYHLDGDKDYAELVPTRRLDADVEGQSQRHTLSAQLDTLPDRLTPGGTGLYDTTLAAVRAAQADYNPDAVNSVLVVTDGTDDDDQSIGLQGLLDTLRSEANPDRPVKVIGVALGPDADLDVLQQIAEVTGGAAYSAKDPTDLQDVLFDALRQRQ
ncbi:substrate-binding domain-containing protein [Petropleomorpha daqingensis]|uniref:VWFA domain-containing protein n=1 Tax=Petropleomorpha daqingensis TaxID=2026353 RepID=A0A853CDI9_9ACTN|nr:substrate-binding domain-containing protein [Petropleomorpha daqingensis]NYJ05920.1 hypothetical protein [Petropleomorpha daqingensis]